MLQHADQHLVAFCWYVCYLYDGLLGGALFQVGRRKTSVAVNRIDLMLQYLNGAVLTMNSTTCANKWTSKHAGLVSSISCVAN